MKSSINFRNEFDEFMEDYGYPVLLQRAGRKIRCRCWNEKYQEAESKCPICIGSGWVSRIERHTLRHKAAPVISRSGMLNQAEVGKMWIEGRVFYMRHDSHPRVMDLIYEVGWTESQKPSHLMNTYRINDVVPNRGDNGRIEYWTVSTTSETTNLDWQNIVVRSIGPIQNYEMVQK